MNDLLIHCTILIYYFLSVFSISYLYKKYKICPQIFWIAFQLLMFVGISFYIDISLNSDRQLIGLYLVGLLSFLVGMILFILLYRPSRIINFYSDPERFKVRRPYLYLMMGVSIILCSYFFLSAGSNAFISGVYSIFSETEYSVKFARKSFLSISGVGYIYQLRVTVLPLCVLYYVMINKKTIMSYVLTFIMLIFLLGTGQRGGFASYIAIVLITIYYWPYFNKKKSVSKVQVNKSKLFMKVFAFALFLFSLSTIINKRISETGTVFGAIIQRLLFDNQACAVRGFRFISNEQIQFGNDWLMQLLDILPGKNYYTSLATRIFAIINGGSTAGTAPPCIWGSTYYNFDIFGVIILGFLLGCFTTLIHASFTRKNCDELDTIVYSALQFLLAFWVADGPVVLFNNGFISVVIFAFIMRLALKYRIKVFIKKPNGC